MFNYSNYDAGLFPLLLLVFYYLASIFLGQPNYRASSVNLPNDITVIKIIFTALTTKQLSLSNCTTKTDRAMS